MPRKRFNKACEDCGKPAVHKTFYCWECLVRLAATQPTVDHARIRRIYDLDADQHTRLYALQSGRCGICRKKKPLHVDHDHKTGKVRGLLCRGCNIGLGMFQDDGTALRQAARYLDTPPAETVRYARAEVG